MKRYVIIVIDEAWASFLVTDDKELWKETKRAEKKGEDAFIDWLYGDDEKSDEFERLDDLTGIEVLGLLQLAPY